MCSVTQLCPTLQPHGLQPASLLCAWNSPGKNTGVGSLFLLQGIFPSGSNSSCRSLIYISSTKKHTSPLYNLPSCFHSILAAPAAKSIQSCPTLSDPMDCSLPGSSIHGIFQARVLEWDTIAFSGTFPLALLLQCPTGFGLLYFHFHLFLCIF